MKETIEEQIEKILLKHGVRSKDPKRLKEDLKNLHHKLVGEFIYKIENYENNRTR